MLNKSSESVKISFLFGLFIILTSVLKVSSSKVIELSDRFLELKGDSTWIVMFYAPWCGHCKKMEPVWNHVAQALYNTEIRVGRVDCTRFTVMANEFSIKGFPTIMYLSGDSYEIYKGERTTEEIVGFAMRMASPPVPQLTHSELEEKIKKLNVFFLYTGKREGYLWETFYSQASEYRHFHFFYSVDLPIPQKVFEPTVLVIKDNSYHKFLSSELISNLRDLNQSLAHWINNERFSLFVKYTHGNFHQLSKVNKLLSITVLQENKVGGLEVDEYVDEPTNPYRFREMAESFVREKEKKYCQHFQFGWTGSPDLINGIALRRLPIPSFIVINISSLHFFLPEQSSHLLTPEHLEVFLDLILNDDAQPFGGDTYFLRLYRMYYTAKTSLEDMWWGNPVLTALLFGLPMGFLSLICYSIWCSDILDADEDEVAEKVHEKKD